MVNIGETKYIPSKRVNSQLFGNFLVMDIYHFYGAIFTLLGWPLNTLSNPPKNLGMGHSSPRIVIARISKKAWTTYPAHDHYMNGIGIKVIVDCGLRYQSAVGRISGTS